MDKLLLNMDTSNEVITVSQLNKLSKLLLENNLPVFWIKGEISGIRNYSHLYFDLKDEGGKISCVIFANSVPNIGFTLENGQKIEIRGKVTIYPQNGSYQINVERVRKVGIGELWEAYTRLLNKLKAEGLFDAKYKKKIPAYPTSIGVITSKEGSVIRDVITTLKRRISNIPIIIYHSAVQGNDAGMQITKAIQIANKRNEVDVLIICRGGGSMQDLWCFNEEVVAREVFASNIPIISAIGHETDNTIIDFVADLRAPTPTGAAEMVIKSRSEWVMILNRIEQNLKNNLLNQINFKKQSLDTYFLQMKLLNPMRQIRDKSALTKHYQVNLNKLLLQKINSAKLKLQRIEVKLDIKKISIIPYSKAINQLAKSLNLGIKHKIKHDMAILINIKKHMELINPMNILSRGYAIIRNETGKVLTSSKDVIQNERVNILLKDDSVSAIIDKIDHLKG